MPDFTGVTMTTDYKTILSQINDKATSLQIASRDRNRLTNAKKEGSTSVEKWGTSTKVVDSTTDNFQFSAEETQSTSDRTKVLNEKSTNSYSLGTTLVSKFGGVKTSWKNKSTAMSTPNKKIVFTANPTFGQGIQTTKTGVLSMIYFVLGQFKVRSQCLLEYIPYLN